MKNLKKYISEKPAGKPLREMVRNKDNAGVQDWLARAARGEPVMIT